MIIFGYKESVVEVRQRSHATHP